MYSVLIVDDHKSMCDSLSLALAGTGEFNILATLESAALADPYCRQNKPDLIITDVCTKGNASGIDAAKLILERFPEIKIIVMSGFDEISYAPRAKEIGAHAFVYKSESLNHFTEIARRVMQGEICHPEPRTLPRPMGEAPLTDREMEVLRLLCRGMSNQKIAEELHISAETVKYHKSNMLAKTGFQTATELVAYMLSHGWINPNY
jgi:DNA-binding NarL/FixJ family response regulator